MKRQLIAVLALCAACLVAQGQGASGSSGAAGSSGSGSLSPTGRSMSHHEIQASKLNNCSVQGSSGETLGTIQDVVINPASGKVDFAILSLNSAGSSSSVSPSSSTPSTSSGISGASSTSGKQVAVPWSLLRASSSGGISGGASSSSSTSGSIGPTFTFNGDTSKLQSAPAFDASADINQPRWRQSVFSYFGVSPGSATGGSEYPSSGSSSGGSSSTNSDSSTN